MCYGKIEFHLVEPSALPMGILIEIPQEFLKNSKKDYICTYFCQKEKLCVVRQCHQNHWSRILIEKSLWQQNSSIITYSQTKYMAIKFFKNSGQKSRWFCQITHNHGRIRANVFFFAISVKIWVIDKMSAHHRKLEKHHERGQFYVTPCLKGTASA